jgi:ribosomal 50S subunit-associated protein YjgA (DUF615 family)
MAEQASAVAAGPLEDEVLTAEEVIAILRLKDLAPRKPREALRGLVRRGQLRCLRNGPGRSTRMVFLRRHVQELLARWERWGEREN